MRTQTLTFNAVLLLSSALIFLSACGGKITSFSLLSEGEDFTQSVAFYNNKVDILWVVDGSGTMANHQQNLGNNFSAFINEFAAKNFDYHMAVASTDAWLREVDYNGGSCWTNPNPSKSPNTVYFSSADCARTHATFGDLTKFRDGDIYGTANGPAGLRSAIFLLTSAMHLDDVIDLFRINVKVGVRGDGAREAGFQSLRSVLRRNSDGSPGYNGETFAGLNEFRRPNAYLSVIFVTDEEDQSRKRNGSAYSSKEQYTQEFIQFMDGYTGYTEGTRQYSISSIVVDDINNCSYGLHDQANQGDRYVAIAQATGGVVGNICSPDFSSSLSMIARNVVTLLSRFKIQHEPAKETIEVVVDGVLIAEDKFNGWTYTVDEGQHYINFHGTSVPAQGASIRVTYDLANLK